MGNTEEEDYRLITMATMLFDDFSDFLSRCSAVSVYMAHQLWLRDLKKNKQKRKNPHLEIIITQSYPTENDRELDENCGSGGRGWLA